MMTLEELILEQDCANSLEQFCNDERLAWILNCEAMDILLTNNDISYNQITCIHESLNSACL